MGSDMDPRAVSVRFGPAARLQTFLLSEPIDPALAAREPVVVSTEHGPETGYVESVPQAVLGRRAPPGPEFVAIRRATPEDAIERLRVEQRASEARRFAIERIRAQQLPMKLSRAEQSPDGSRLIFHFTSEVRVDFRELVRELATRFRTRIEMRQIGVRDEARMLGGYGSCGRPLCCTTWLTSFEPVSIRMAKQQDLALNPSKLSGLCGRLKCCLRYELPNAKGVVHGGCGDEGGCKNPSGCGTGNGCGAGCSCGRT
jgi:cell fate regulator YaaT (PSP1 superfamily)